MTHYFETVFMTPTFFIFTTPGGHFFIAEGRDGAEPRLDDARPIRIRTADADCCETVKPRTLRVDSIAYISPEEGETPTDIFKEGIADLPQEAQDFLLKRFQHELKKADDWFRI